MCSSFSLLENVLQFYMKSPEFTRNKEFCSCFESPGTHNLNNDHQFLWIQSASRKTACIKIEQYMESELSSIFWVEMVAKNIVLGTLGAQRWFASAVWCLLLRKYKNVVNETVTTLAFSFLNSILVWFISKKSHLTNWVFLFVGPQWLISCGKIFDAYQV